MPAICHSKGTENPAVVPRRRVGLSGGPFVKVPGNKGVKEVGYPYGHDGRGVSARGENHRNLHKKNVGETEQQSQSEVQPQSTLDLPGGQGNPDDGQDKGRKGIADSFMALDGEFRGVDASELHAPDFIDQLPGGEGFHVVTLHLVILWGHVQRGIDMVPVGDELLVAHKSPSPVIVDGPPCRILIPADVVGRDLLHQLLLLKFLHGETGADVAGTESIHIDIHPRFNLAVDMALDLKVVVVDIVVPEVYSFTVGTGNDVIPQEPGEEGDEGRRYQVGAHQPLVGNSAAQNGDDFGIVGHLGGEVDDRNKDKKRTEEVGKVRNEVEVILKDNVFGGDVFRNEFVEVFRDVEDRGDADDQGNGIEEGSEELPGDIKVDGFVVLHLRACV